MTKKIFKSTVLVSAMILILGSVLVMGILYRYFGKQLNGELEKEASYLAYGVEQSGVNYLEHLKQKDARITYIDASGNVLYDSQADISSMENHSDRKEFEEAVQKGHGYAERMSSTLSEKTVYYARKLTDGTVIRVAVVHSSILALMLQLLPSVIGVAIVMLILAGIAAARISAKIVKPINTLDLDHPEDNQIYEEVGPLLSRIHKQNCQIQMQLETARRNQEEFQIITENMQEGLLVIDAYTMILSGNSSVWRMFQLREPKIGDSVYSLDRNEDFRKVIEDVLKGQHGSAMLQLDGEYVQLIANPVSRDDRVIGAVLLLVNETEKVERENLRREFSANVSHELKTPLTSISGFAEIIQDGIVQGEDVQKFAGRIYREAQRLIQLVEDTIKISQLDEGENPYEWEKVDAYAVVKNVCGNLRDIAAKRNVHLFIDGEKLIFCTVKPILEEVIYNLCDNGIKYNREDGTVSIHLQELKDSVEIRVKDNGIGIPREDCGRVFERFYRVDKSHSKAIGGTGLGLSIVKHGVTFLGGTLKMLSEEGKGTEIIMTFPKERKSDE